jgi:murein DD-endopeptidase MepM/ murein hydrolase activator NlpD
MSGINKSYEAAKIRDLDDVRLIQKLAWAIPGVTRSVTGYFFGEHWLNGYCSFHKKLHVGNDYTDNASEGRPIHATSRGFVKQIANQGGWGYAVILQHEDKFTTSYLHLNFPSVSVGQEVQRGTLLGTTKFLVDEAGNHISHLHFGMRVADFNNPVSQAGALPEAACTINGTLYPGFPAFFLDSQSMNW